MEKERKLRGDSHNGGSRRTDGGSGGGGGGRGVCRWLEDLTGKDVGVLALVDGDQRRGGICHGKRGKEMW